jgi:hypothetical protein
MTDTPTPIAGWYPDPAGEGRIQWWDGSQWTEHFAEPAAQPEQPSAPAYGTGAPTYGQTSPTYGAGTGAGAAAAAPYAAQPYSPADPYNVMGQKLTAPAGTRTGTPFIWALAALPVISLISTVITWLSIDDQIDAALDPDAPLFTGSDFISFAVSFLVAALAILFGVLDHRALVRAGVPKPFHWAWIFFALINVPVYIIGRSVIVRRRTGSGLAPMFLYLALWVATFIVNAIFTAASLGPILDELSQTGY